jgi:uncharacterized membrane protein
MSEEPRDKQLEPKPLEPKPPEPSKSDGIVVGKLSYSREHYSGPLPRPSDLQEYEKIVPGSAERILKMAETQATHRRSMESIVIRGDSRRATCGLWIGAAVAACFLGGGIFLIYEGHDWAGITIAGLDIVSLVSVFVYGSNSRRQERSEKAQAINKPKKTKPS